MIPDMHRATPLSVKGQGVAPSLLAINEDMSILLRIVIHAIRELIILTAPGLLLLVVCIAVAGPYALFPAFGFLLLALVFDSLLAGE